MSVCFVSDLKFSLKNRKPVAQEYSPFFNNQALDSYFLEFDTKTHICHVPCKICPQHRTMTKIRIHIKIKSNPLIALIQQLYSYRINSALFTVLIDIFHQRVQ